MYMLGKVLTVHMTMGRYASNATTVQSFAIVISAITDLTLINPEPH